MIKNKIKYIFILPFLIFPGHIFAQTSEYETKSAYIEQFTRFIEWPANTGINDTTVLFVIGFLGECAISSALEKMKKKLKIKNKKVEIIYFNNISSTPNCHILIISTKIKTNKQKNYSILFKINRY